MIRKDGDRPCIQVEYKGETKELFPEEISSMVLSKMVQTAEEFLDKEVPNAVITVRTKSAGPMRGSSSLGAACHCHLPTSVLYIYVLPPCIII